MEERTGQETSWYTWNFFCYIVKCTLGGFLVFFSLPSELKRRSRPGSLLLSLIELHNRSSLFPFNFYVLSGIHFIEGLRSFFSP